MCQFFILKSWNPFQIFIDDLKRFICNIDHSYNSAKQSNVTFLFNKLPSKRNAKINYSVSLKFKSKFIKVCKQGDYNILNNITNQFELSMKDCWENVCQNIRPFVLIISPQIAMETHPQLKYMIFIKHLTWQMFKYLVSAKK